MVFSAITNNYNWNIFFTPITIYDWHVVHISLLFIFYKLSLTNQCRKVEGNHVSFEPYSKGANHLTFVGGGGVGGAMGDLVWVSQIFGDRIIFRDVQLWCNIFPALYTV